MCINELDIYIKCKIIIGPCREKTCLWRIANNKGADLRNANDFRTLHANTNLYFNSFFPSTIRAWNSLPEETKQAPSIAYFKHRLNRDLNRPPIYFNAGTRNGQILHTRLRLECSSLNSHLCRKNLVPEPTCKCGALESSYHYLFVSPKRKIFARKS